MTEPKNLNFEILRGRTHVLLEAKDNDTLMILKQKLEAVLKVKPDDQKLFYGNKHLEKDDGPLSDYGINETNASVMQPAQIYLAIKIDGKFDDPYIDPMTSPTPFDQMFNKNKDKGGGDDKSPAHTPIPTP